MDPKTAQILLGSAGAAGGPATYVDDVYSTYLYDGTGANQTITNGIDLSGEGGLVWLKARSSGLENSLFDTERGAGKYLVSNNTAVESTNTTRLSAFNSNGFSLGDDAITNSSGTTYASWTFRKAPGFFDVVTYTGNGSNRTISHSLGSVPGMIIIAGRDIGTNKFVYHRSLGNTKYLRLNTTATATTSSTAWNNTDPTSSVFTLGTNGSVNTSGQTYVAWIFAHDDQSFGTDGNEAIIKCGSYTGDGQNSGKTVDVGFEPQWLMIKAADTTGRDWHILDVSRELSEDSMNRLFPNEAFAEALTGSGIQIRSDGWEFFNGGDDLNKSGDEYIYVAIRRPHKPPEAGTDVYDGKTRSGTGATITNTNDLDQPDFVLTKKRTTTSAAWVWSNRLNGYYTLKSDSSAARSASVHGTEVIWDYQNAIKYRNEDELNASSHTYVDFFFKRAAGFFDVVTYKGDGTSGRTINHNLGAVPELWIFKRTDAVGSFTVGSSYLSNPTGDRLILNSDGAVAATGITAWTNTATTFLADYNGIFNGSGNGYISWFFASIDGISKIGTYSGSSSAVDVDCGFTAGARFIIIKRIDIAADWFVLDSDRGIVSGNDPHLRLNISNTELSNYDNIDPLNAGFTVTSSAPGALNASGGTFLFLAIA